MVEDTVRRLVDGQFLTEEEASVIQPEKIMKLMSSDLGRRLAESTTGKKVKEAYLYLTDSGELVEM